MADRNDDRVRRSVAFVTHTREYRAAEVLPTLARQGYITTERPHDRETERLLIQLAPDLVLLAVDPRQEQDLTVIGSVARATRASLVVLAPGPHVNGMASALEAGADVCLRDTDGAELLAAQLNAISRKRGGATAFDAFEGAPTSITVRDLQLDFDRCQATRGDELIPLTPTEFKILAYLARNAGKVISPVEILRAVQDPTMCPLPTLPGQSFPMDNCMSADEVNNQALVEQRRREYIEYFKDQIRDLDLMRGFYGIFGRAF